MGEGRTTDEQRRKGRRRAAEGHSVAGGGRARMMAFVAVVSIANWARKAQCLECIQCDRQTLWYSPEENERHIGRCQRGLIPPSQCANSSHTHCIFSYFKQGGVITITERRCGTADEISGCTLYKSMMRAKRHLIAGSAIDVEPTKLWRVGNAGQSPPSHRRRETNPLVVEVCTGGCKENGCVNGVGGGGEAKWTTAWIVVIGWVAWWTSTRTRTVDGRTRQTHDGRAGG
ncbi:hypothetical protein niasHT_003811 [Heterodera trifolii]|uniref:Uncharacterized protein n=1 Tax=Heterodera trifolii TaxID=157864 RepID=A0ABD2LUV3_9BILA